jgi:signal transduction histidine kinase
MPAARRVPPWRDALLAGAVVVIAIAEVVANGAIAPKGVAIATEVAMAVALWWRHSLPLVAIGTISVLQVCEAAAGVPLNQPIVPLLASAIAVYAVVAHTRLWRGLAGLMLLVVAVGVVTLLQHKGFGNFVFALIFIVAAFFVARTVAYRARHAAALQHRADELEERREVDAQQAAEAERARIARELHDVIAHSVGVMVVQAGAAERVLDIDRRSAVQALRAVQSTGRQAMTEMARLVGMLREAGEEIGLAPQPGMEDIAALAEQSRTAGVPVQVCVEGQPQPVPPALALTIYRIVQEALTNIRKHAGNARATVRLRYGAASIEAEIIDTGDASAVPGQGSGHGLIGMRERVAVYGGTLTTGRAASGGYLVRARLPMDLEQ